MSLSVATAMPRELSVAEAAAAPAMSTTASVADMVASIKSLFQFLTKHGLQTKVFAAWALWFLLRYLQSILGPMRGRSGHWLVYYGAMAAYYLPTVIAFSAASAVYSSQESDDLKYILTVGCFFLLFSSARGAVTMTAFSLEHDPVRPQSWQLLPWLLYFAWLQLEQIRSNGKMELPDVISFALFFIVPLLYLVLAKPRSRAAILDQETKEVADYMVRVSRSSSPAPPFFPGDGDATRRLYDRCRYPFMQLTDGRWITFSNVLQQHWRLPRDCAVDLDTCLAYSFCQLLARRYFGFPCTEDGNEQVRDFVLTELLADWNRAFTTVEVQLALLHDYFFTNYHSSLTTGLVSVKQGMVAFLRDSLPVLAGLLLSVVINVISGRPPRLLHLLVVIPVALLLAYIVIGQVASPVLPAHWHPIRNIFLYYPLNDATANPPTIDRIVPPRSNDSRLPPQYWKGKIGQYSVMEDFDRRSFNKALIAWCKVHLLSQVSYIFIKHHPAEEEDVSVPYCVKRLVARTIQQINTLGVVVDRDNRSHDDHYISWTCRQETTTHTILIWHVATCYCEMMSQEETVEENLSQQSQPLQEPSTEYRKVATTLSRYCAYLVAFLPELLPEPSLTAKVVLHEVLQETRDLLVQGRRRMTIEEKRTRIQELELPLPEEDDGSSGLNTFQKGVRLGRQLELEPDISFRWKIMADFWAKMIMYISSADKASAHIEQLAHGGEFLTHLWALLSNAGILKVATEAWTTAYGRT